MRSSVRVAALVAMLGVTLVARSYLRINWTDSLPRGLYVVASVPRSGVERGALIVACPPRAFAEIGRVHRYLLIGQCPGDVAPLLKIVAARAGDVVRLSRSGLVVNGALLPHTSLLERDVRGERPRHVAFGTYRVAQGEIWVFTPKDAGYDSRYFGAIRTGSVLGAALPLLTVS